MNSYFKHFTIPFIIVGIITVISLVVYSSNKTVIERDNTSTDLTTNVFNLAGNLSDEHVAALEETISEMEDQIGCDIALVTLDETLEDYVKPYEQKIGTQPTEKWVMVYADNFADEHAMGYDMPHGNSIVIVDNIYRESSSGHVHTWISTSGLAQDRISQAECEAIMDDALYNLTDDSGSDDFYYAYNRMVELLPAYMSSAGGAAGAFKTPYVLLAALIVSVVYVLVNLRSKVGKKTTTGNTYVEGGEPNMKVRTDQFINKTVTKRKIQSSSGSGGSGGHTSAGGFSHGGGGHSR